MHIICWTIVVQFSSSIFFLSIQIGSGDSGVVTVSESNCRIGNDGSGQRRNSAEESPLSYRPRYCDPHRNPMERVLLEIVDTEAIYVEHLRQVIQVIFRFLYSYRSIQKNNT